MGYFFEVNMQHSYYFQHDRKQVELDTWRDSVIAELTSVRDRLEQILKVKAA